MGFEEVTPPIPDRIQEQKGNTRIEKSWLSQGWLKYYMNENLREPKIAYGKKLNWLYSELSLNFLLISGMLLPLVLLSRRFFIKRGGVPYTYQPDYFGKRRSDWYMRNRDHIIYTLPIWLGSSLFLAHLNTDFEPVFDHTYNHVHKTPVMIE